MDLLTINIFFALVGFQRKTHYLLQLLWVLTVLNKFILSISLVYTSLDLLQDVIFFQEALLAFFIAFLYKTSEAFFISKSCSPSSIGWEVFKAR